MEGKPRLFYQSLGFHLLLPLFITVVLVLAVHAVIGFRSTKDHFVRFVRTDIDRYSRLIKRATHDGMLLNRKDEVQGIIERLAQGSEIATIRVYNKVGEIMMSAERSEIGQHVELRSDTCLSCHSEEPTRDVALMERNSVARVGGGLEVLRHLSVIENEPSCSTAACHAHPTGNKVLGVLDFEMSMTPLETAIRAAQTQFLWTTLILSLIVGVVAAVFIRRAVQRPVYQLYEGTRRVADGDLDTRIEVHGRHELARLAEAFNRMAADLGAARREVTEWSQNLEEKVAQKTEELGRIQRHVLQIEKMASLGRLSAIVAHELNNPIGGMLTYARLVKRELAQQPIEAGVREELTRYLSMMERECTRCGSIVHNLLLFSRQSGATMTSTDLNEVVERSLMLVRHQLELSGAKLHTELLAADSRIVADAGQLEQAVVALLVNAVEAMSGSDRRDGELTVRLYGNDGEVRIEVGDTGPGIPPDALSHIFEPFFSTKANGVGLGLAVVYGIVQRHGGQIEVESSAGQGTLFRVRLPRHGEGSGFGAQGSEIGTHD
jgi:two-component system NtrC family sensor kinase